LSAAETDVVADPGERTALNRSLRAAWSDNRYLLIAVGASLLAGFLIEALSGPTGLMRDVFSTASFQYMLLFLFLPLPFGLLIGRLGVKDPSGRFLPGVAGWQIALQRFVDRFLNPGSLLRALIAGGCIALLINVYGSWKRAFPVLFPFTWDAEFTRLDRTVHLGNDPWRLLHPLLGHHQTTLLLDYVYYTWLPVTFALLGWMVWTRRSDLRSRGLMGVVFVWLGLGGIGATLFSSAGPCYYGYLVDGPNPFQPLLTYLGSVSGDAPLFAPRLQAALWSFHENGTADIYTGISAMPSVHVAMPALYALVLGARNRWLGIALWGYTGLILIATIHLAWHYAIDGYFSIIAVLLYWKLSARLGRRHQPAEAA
jgi:hypothetical protein